VTVDAARDLTASKIGGYGVDYRVDTANGLVASGATMT
jgi:hypothetical protein